MLGECGTIDQFRRVSLANALAASWQIFCNPYAHFLPPMRNKGMVPIASFDDSQPAEALARRLSEDGYTVTTQSDAGEQLFHFLNPHPHAQWHVAVSKEEFNGAMTRLRELDVTEKLLRFAIQCPDCGSTEVEYPQFSRNTILGAVPVAAAAALGIIERQFYCSACHFTWTPKEESAAGKDLLR